MRVENGSPRSSCGPSPRRSKFSSDLCEVASHSHLHDPSTLKRVNSGDSQDSLRVESAFCEQFTPRAGAAVGEYMPSFRLSTSRSEQTTGVSPVNLPLSLNIPVKMEDAPEEDREAAQALVSLADCNDATSACHGALPLTLGQKRGFGDLSVNTSLGIPEAAGGPFLVMPLKKRRAAAAARRMSMKLYSSVSPPHVETLVRTPTPSFQRTLSVLAATATELCSGDSLFMMHDQRQKLCPLESAVCIQLSQKY